MSSPIPIRCNSTQASNAASLSPTQALNKGDLLLSLKYNPVDKILQGVVLKVTSLKQQYIIGLAGK